MRGRGAIQLLTLLLPLTLCCNAWARNADANVGPEQQSARIVSLEWASEAEYPADIQAVASGQAGLDFQPMPENRNLGFQDMPVWIHARLDLAGQSSRHLLEIEYTQLDRVEIFWRERGRWVTHVAGDRVPFVKRTETAPRPVFRLPDVNGLFDVYFRVEMSGSLQFPLRLWNQDDYASYYSNLQFFTGLYFAVIGTMMLYNLFLFTAIRDMAYLYLVTYLAGLLGFQLAISGHGSMYLWPWANEWAHQSVVVFLCVCIASGNMFVNTMTGGGSIVPTAARALPLLALMALLPLPILAFDYSLALKLLILIALVSVLYYPWPIILALMRGYWPARFVALGFFMIAPGALLMMARFYEWLPANFWTVHGLKLGTTAEALLFSFAVADRINLLRKERDLARDRLLETKQQALISQRLYSRRLLDAQDTERRRLARELHDGFGQALATTANSLKRWMRKDTAPAPEEYREVTALAKGMMEDVRSISHNLHPHQLDKLGLKAALLSVAEHAGNTEGLTVDHDIQNLEADLSDEEKLHIYRLAQEALSNIQRHARATRAGVQLVRKGDSVVLRVTDNGIGLSAGEDGQSLGLISMQERARAMGARLEITGRADNGTTVELTLPVGMRA